ncbi:MAG TPA: 2-oxoglutarate and iron-dependent oxygenase domain-containing protein [Chitinophagales bacterium]|nr:2-oxoglutarate and iron-dependent oxygenase domain-containing protein [Chitinophagales bacterium]
MSFPVIDVSALITGDSALSLKAAEALGCACRDNGFFYITGHGVDEELQKRLDQYSRDFFALDETEKMKISMSKGGRAWRGYFRLGGELTSGKPDWKEGIYFGKELPASDRRVKAGLPLHGSNLFPEYPAELKETVIQYMDALTQTGHALMKGIAMSLGLQPSYFHDRCTADPLILFRIFHYPPPSRPQQWGVGEHTDYGLLTILKQDDAGGLQVLSKGTWLDAPPLPETFVCNIGDMLDRITGGLYRSTPHRVMNISGKSRFSYPFFFDPNYESRVQRIENIPVASDVHYQRWDKENVHLFEGTYGDYLLRKVGRVFPQLEKAVLR